MNRVGFVVDSPIAVRWTGSILSSPDDRFDQVSLRV